MFGKDEQWALALSTFAGLSTTIGAIFAILRRPDDSLLAFLLGTAIGVMFLLSTAEMWIHNAIENGWAPVTACVFFGALLYQVAQPFLPDFKPTDINIINTDINSEKTSHSDRTDKTNEKNSNETTALLKDKENAPITRKDSSGTVKMSTRAQLRKMETNHSGDATLVSGGDQDSMKKGDISSDDDQPKTPGKDLKAKARSAELLRLGLLMAFTMTLHNLPEGFAVAFAAYTDFGPIMAAAIAVHNIPEGVIVAAPVYAATGSRWKALAVATLSGLSEPVGALLALVSVKPFITEERLQYILAFVGGIMAAVCVLELWPEGRKCNADGRLIGGILLGAAVMGWTLWIGV